MLGITRQDFDEPNGEGAGAALHGTAGLLGLNRKTLEKSSAITRRKEVTCT